MDFAQAFIEGQRAGQAAKQAREFHEQRTEENNIQRMLLKHRLEALKLEDTLRGRELDMQRAAFLEGRPEADLPKMPAPTEGVIPGGGWEMPAAPVSIRAAGGLPEDRITPRSAETLQELANQMARAKFQEELNKPVVLPSGAKQVSGGRTIAENPRPVAPAPVERPAPLEQQLLDAMRSGDTAAEGMIRQAMNARDNKPSGDLSPTIQRLVAAKAKGFESNPIVKKTQTMAEAVSFADGLNPNTTNPADDQALIYAFAKGMDPDSVVREGEYATVQKYAQSWAEKFGFDAKRVFSNTAFLTPEARANMKATIRAKYQAGRKQYDNVRKEYGRQIERITKRPGGVDELIDFGAAFPSLDEMGSTVKMKAPDGQVRDVPADQVEHYKGLGATVVKG